MNDFTKDELQEIKRCLKYMINGNHTPFSCLTMELNKKLQSVIQNYCDHEKEPKKQYWAADARLYNKCIKCGLLYRE